MVISKKQFAVGNQVTVGPIDPMAYFAQQEEIRSARMRAGWTQGYARQNQMLVYAGTSVTPLEEELLRRALDRATVSNSNVERLGAAIISVMMTTGRGLDEIAQLTFESDAGGQPLPLVPMLRGEPEWTWWLAPGVPSSPQILNSQSPLPDMRPKIVPIPCSIRSRTLITSCRPRSGDALFRHSPAELAVAAKSFLRSVKIEASLSTVRCWLFTKLTWIEDGDVGIAALVTGHCPVIAQTVVHYTALSVAAIPALVKRALAGFDVVPLIPTPCALIEARVGSRFAPTVGDVRQLVGALRTAITSAKRQRNVAKVHNAITLYTTVLIYMSTGCRPTPNLIPDISLLDPHTRFLIVNDKPTRDNYKSRIVWIGNDCHKQFSLYGKHLSALTARLNGTSALPNHTFWLNPAQKPIRVTRSWIGKRLKALNWNFPLNAGRHFLRTALAGTVSTEGLHALLGHWHLGNEPWAAASSLDPIAYRSEIAGSVELLLRRCEFRPIPGLL